MKRRDFIKYTTIFLTNIFSSPSKLKNIPDYEETLEFSGWQKYKNIEFSQTRVYKGRDLVDIVNAVKINPRENKFEVVSSYNEMFKDAVFFSLKEWQEITKADVVFNCIQYMSEPRGKPVALMLLNGEYQGPRTNKFTRGMFISEPKNKNLPLTDIIDFDYVKVDDQYISNYKYGFMHWPILLDKEGRIKVKRTNKHARRTVIAKDFDGNIIIFNTEKDFFSLYDFGKFLKIDRKKYNHYKVHIAMNLDGGSSSGLLINVDGFSYCSGNPSLPFVVIVHKR